MQSLHFFDIGLLPCERIVDQLCVVDLFHVAFSSRRGRHLCAAALRRRQPAKIKTIRYAQLAKQVYEYVCTTGHWRRDCRRQSWLYDAYNLVYKCLVNDCVDLAAELDALACFDVHQLFSEPRDLAQLSARAFLFVQNVIGNVCGDEAGFFDAIVAAVQEDNYDLANEISNQSPDLQTEFSDRLESMWFFVNLVRDITSTEDARNDALLRRVLWFLKNKHARLDENEWHQCFEHVCASWHPTSAKLSQNDKKKWNELIDVCQIDRMLLSKHWWLGEGEHRVNLFSALDVDE